MSQAQRQVVRECPQETARTTTSAGRFRSGPMIRLRSSRWFGSTIRRSISESSSASRPGTPTTISTAQTSDVPARGLDARRERLHSGRMGRTAIRGI